MQKQTNQKMTTTLEKLKEAANHASNTTQALRDSGIAANNVTGDCILPLIQRAAELKRDIMRLAEMVNLDENE